MAVGYAVSKNLKFHVFLSRKQNQGLMLEIIKKYVVVMNFLHYAVVFMMFWTSGRSLYLLGT